MFAPTKAPWINPGVVIHEPDAPVDEMIAKFARTIAGRGFIVGGCVRIGEETIDLATGAAINLDGEAAAARCLRAAMREDADLAVISGFPAFRRAAIDLTAEVGQGASQGMPVLTTIPDGSVQHWHDFVGTGGALIPPAMRGLWRWWGPERLYCDLALGVAGDEVRQIVIGPRWLMVEGPAGAGLAYLPRNARDLIGRLPEFRKMSLKQLAEFSGSWDPLEMALGIAAINAHYNRFDLEGEMGNGAQIFGQEAGRVVVIGAFPGLSETLPNPQVIENDPRPGEYPTIAMDTLLPGCAAAVVASSTLVNRNLPRILRLAQGSRVALIGPVTPLTPRLHAYGVEIVGGMVVRDAKGLAAAIRAGALPREFSRFGQYLHLRREDAPQAKLCRFNAFPRNG
ncbi:Rossmann-like domain-containing protein [Magnetospirillum molischianum]|uniref:DUF2478 domain-containing protein n=1 Tax=Magnetospirillum molischianum DSM 120 TaxID=1150626 RepID=H8FRL1_MAGML|nr:DUF364 domain-containing protein [Magnetospirillum molischianum]CCG40999.1 conserved hypothetical protein [Magnetospirillum molischianum DSM 120]